MLKVVLPTFSILLGFWVAFVRPRDLAAWLLIGVLLGLSNLFASGIESWGRWVRDLAEFYRTGCNEAWPLCMLFFGLYFPQAFPAQQSTRLGTVGEVYARPRANRRCVYLHCHPDGRN